MPYKNAVSTSRMLENHRAPNVRAFTTCLFRNYELFYAFTVLIVSNQSCIFNRTFDRVFGRVFSRVVFSIVFHSCFGRVQSCIIFIRVLFVRVK